MKRNMILALGLAIALCSPALGEDLLTAEDSVTEAVAGFYVTDADGNQDWVRQYDGRKFYQGYGLELFDTYGYSGPLQYSVWGRDLLLTDEDAFTDLAYKNTFGFGFFTSALTHRLPIIPSVNPYLNPLGITGDNFLDLSPGLQTEIDRRVNDFTFRTTPYGNQRVRLVAGLWQEIENGSQQLLFRAREAQPGVIANRQRAGVVLPVNRDTDETSFGTDLALGRSTVLNYRYMNTDFDDNAGHPAAGSDLDFLPLNSLTRIKTDTRANVLKARSQFSGKLHFTGVYINKNRTNTAQTLVDRAKSSIDSTNLALTYLATDDLTVTGRYRKLDMDSEVAPYSGGNQQLSRNTKSSEISASYTGIPRTYIQLGYERRDTDRYLLEESTPPPLPFTSLTTDWNIVSARVRYYPTLRLSVSGSFQTKSSNNSGYAGAPNDITNGNVNATYMVTDNLALYGDYSKVSEKNDQIRVPYSAVVAAQPGDEDYEDVRLEAVGQGYDFDNSVATLGAWYALSSKLVLDANYARIKTNSSNLWILGEDPNYLPHLAPNVANYEANNSQWSFGATYAVNPKWRVFGRYAQSDSDGATLLNTAVYPAGMPAQWTPVDVREKRYTIGFAHDLTMRDTLSMDFSLSDWLDQIDSSQSGKYKLWRLAWAHQF